MADIKFIPILPKVAKLIDLARLQRELRDALDHTANIVRDDFQKTTNTWTRKPNFRKEGPRQKGPDLEAIVSTDQDVYRFLTRGTRKNYPIPKNPFMGRRRLRFREGYKAKTRPRVIGSRAGGAFGKTRFARQVIHPGIEARNFDIEIARRRQKNHENLIRLAIRRSIRLT
ncbi:MAG TPA: hypothetical protein VI729_04085 [Anaerolineales bacterium]|nr:hypothetical protein [Anaerolineales bacterium]